MSDCKDPSFASRCWDTWMKKCYGGQNNGNLNLRGTMGSEPRLHIQNNASGHLLHANGDWKADTVGYQHAGERDVKFKVQWSEKTGEFASTVMIRTDSHPQSLLDASDLAYQGGALDSRKCYDKNRWWKLTYLELSETKVTVMFESFTKGKYLAETIDGTGVELLQIDKNLPINEIPGRAKWDLAIGGSAFTPGEAARIIIGAPFAAAVGAIAAAGSMGTLGAVLIGAGATTLGAMASTTTAIAAGAAIGAISGATVQVLDHVLKEVSDKMFVDW